MVGIAALVGLAAGVLIGAIIGAVVGRARGDVARSGELREARAEVLAASEARARAEAALASEQRAAADKLALLTATQAELRANLEAIGAQAIEQAMARAGAESRRDLDERRLAVEHLVAPLRETLDGVKSHLRELEVARTAANASLLEQVTALGASHDRLQAETANLVTALRAPHVRGRWGETQLRNVVEMAGMVAHCDFVEQPTLRTGDSLLRPDLIVRLPGAKSVVVDAKAPLAAYLESVDAPDEATRKDRLVDHVRQLRNHIDKLASKSYWEQVSPSPDFVILFIPGEPFLHAALQTDPALFEYAVDRGVHLASPSTLIVQLKSVAVVWRQETLAASAQRVCDLGRELYQRIGTMAEHFEQLGGGLTRAVDSYNKTLGSLESRVLVTARKFVDLEVAQPVKALIDPAEPIDKQAREVPGASRRSRPGAPAPILPFGARDNGGDGEPAGWPRHGSDRVEEGRGSAG